MSAAVVEPPAINIALPRPKTLSRNGNTHRFTLEEYFALEAASTIRYEYDEGVLIPMPGTSFEHNEIAGNIYTALKIAFKGTKCRVYIEAVRLRVSPVKYRYPDVMALCAEAISDGNQPPALFNPALLVEVISASTEDTDKGKKIDEYLRIASLQDYILVEQETVRVMHWSRQNDSQWMRTEYFRLDDVVTFGSIGQSMSLREMYENVSLQSESEPQSK